MDIISHGLCGVLLSGFDRGKWLGPGARVAAAIGAVAPDCDLIIAGAGWDRYLQYHEVGTHTLLAAPAIGVAVALAVRAFLPQSRLTRVWFASLAGVLFGHLGLDVISGADIKLFAPFWNVRQAPHLLAMGDVLVIAILVAGLIFRFRHPRKASIWTAAAIIALIVFKDETQRMALADFARSYGSDPARKSAGHPDAVNGSVFSWMIYERDGNALRVWTVNARTGARTVEFERRADDALEEKTAAVPAIKAFIALLHVPVGRVEAIGGRRTVLWSDLRDCDANACSVSVGAEIDPSGRPTLQIIQVGPFRQTRAIAVDRHAPGD